MLPLDASGGMIRKAWLRRLKKPPVFTRNAVRHPTQKQRYDCSRAESELGIAFRPVENTVREWMQWWIDNGMVAHPERRQTPAQGRGR